jgi:hypothetical protein
MGVPKLGLLLPWNFGHIYLPQIKPFWNMQGKYLIALKKSFQWCIAYPNQRWFDPWSTGICGQESNPQFDSWPFFWSFVLFISSLNGQWKVTLGIYISKKFQWYLGGSIWCMFAFSTKALNIWDSHTSATPKVGVHLGIIGLRLLHSPSFMKVFHTRTHFLSFMGLCIPHLVVNSMLRLQQYVLLDSKHFSCCLYLLFPPTH